MPRCSRKTSSTNVYHLMARGASKQLIFEDDVDRRHFLNLLSEHSDRGALSIMAYCLMENHVHILVEGLVEDLSSTMKNLLASYATWFNLRHGRCGHLFQGRFKSEAVEDDSYLLTVVRYIHENPAVAGLAETEKWRWSSFHEYAGRPSLISADLVLGVIGGKAGFLAFHEDGPHAASALEITDGPKRLADEEAFEVARKVLGARSVRTLKESDRATRNEGLRRLKQQGLGVRQIQRLTGISLSVISKA